MFGKTKKSFEDMTSEERLQAICKMSHEGLCYLKYGRNVKLSPKELEAIDNEFDKREKKSDKIEKGAGILSIMGLLIVGAVELITHSSNND